MVTHLRTYVLILNWNGWRDTCRCLDSLLALEGPRPVIVLCDNGSSDDSIARIRSWVSQLRLSVSHASRTDGDSSLGIRFVEMNRKDAESTVTNVEGDLILIRNGDNLGFGAGCNVGLRFILGCADFDYVWLLNNDTVVDSNALVALINEARRVPDAGMIGSTLRYYDRPNIVQALGGGTFSLKTCSTHHVGEGLEWSSPEKALEISKRFVFAYIVGASILLSKDLLLSIGILHERYFLYFEEIDLATRALRRPSPFQLSYAPDSIVFHKEGASTGTNRGSISSLRWLQRSRIMFVSSFYPSHSLFVRLLVLVDACRLFIKLKIKASVSVAAVALSPVPSENERE